ncbi:MAG: ABC transporter permease [Holosporales bacterium]|jgi:ABC-2 type transport system permease protein
MNIIGTHTLFMKEIRRFCKVLMQTVAAPVITTLLFLCVFILALGDNHIVVPGVDFVHFLVPGLIMMALAQNAFANSSSSLIIAKVNNTIVDLIMSPLGPGEITAAYAVGSMVRGVLVGAAVALSVIPFVPITVHSILYLIYHTLSGALFLGLLGILTGIWAEKFDHVATITNFIVTPLSFLSGTFYSVQRLPEFWQIVAHLNPFFYMIDGVRYSLTGYHDGNLHAGIWVMLACNGACWILCHRWLARGYKLQS